MIKLDHIFKYKKKYLKYKTKYIILRGGVSDTDTKKIIEIIKKITTRAKLLILVNKIKYLAWYEFHENENHENENIVFIKKKNKTDSILVPINDINIMNRNLHGSKYDEIHVQLPDYYIPMDGGVDTMKPEIEIESIKIKEDLKWIINNDPNIPIDEHKVFLDLLIKEIKNNEIIDNKKYFNIKLLLLFKEYLKLRNGFDTYNKDLTQYFITITIALSYTLDKYGKDIYIKSKNSPEEYTIINLKFQPAKQIQYKVIFNHENYIIIKKKNDIEYIYYKDLLILEEILQNFLFKKCIRFRRGVLDDDVDVLIYHPIILEEMPELCLNFIIHKIKSITLFSVKEFNNSFDETIAIDVGGLFKQFFYKLIVNLFDSSNKRYLKIESDYPILQRKTNTEEINTERYILNIGYLITYIYNEKSLHGIARLFKDEYFKILLMIKQAPGSLDYLTLVCHPTLIRVIKFYIAIKNIVSPNELNIENIIENIILYLDGAFTDTKLFEENNLKQLIEELIEQLIEKLDKQSIEKLKPFTNFLINDISSLINEYTKIYDVAKLIGANIPLKILSNPELSSIIQGQKYTAKEIINRFQIDSNNLERDAEYPKFLQKIEWLKKKINSCLPENTEPSLENLEWIKKFIVIITSKEGIVANTQFKFKPTKTSAYNIHTCFSTVDIPILRNADPSVPNSEEDTEEHFLIVFDSVLDDLVFNSA